MKHVLVVLLLCAMPAWTGAAVQIDARLDRSVMPADRPQTAVLRIGLYAPEQVPEFRRAALSLALVIDQSGSMHGEKIHHARLAAREVIRGLAPRDWLAIVTYDSGVQTLAPLAPLTRPERLEALIARIEAGGRTALYGGVQRGAEEIRRGEAPASFQRILLISDGIANVGPSSNHEIAELGRRLARHGISISTIGLGLDYNEDLMTLLARAGDGNTWFARSGRDLSDIVRRELGDLRHLAACDLDLRIRLPKGVRPLRVPGRDDALIDGQELSVEYRQLFSGTERYLLLEVELDAAPDEAVRELASIEVTWSDPESGVRSSQQAAVKAAFSRDAEEVEASMDPEVARARAEVLAAEAREEAISLSDAGRPEAAAARLRTAGESIRALSEPLGDAEAAREGAALGATLQRSADRIERDGLDNESRKGYRAENYKILQQQSR